MLFINGKPYEGVEVNGLRYPLGQHLATSALLFRAIDARTRGGERAYYSDPETYFSLKNPRPRVRDEEDGVCRRK